MGREKRRRGSGGNFVFFFAFPFRVVRSMETAAGEGAFLPGQCLFRITHCHSIGRRTNFHSDICPSIRRRTIFTPSTCRSLCRRTIFHPDNCPSIRRRTIFTPSTCRSLCRRTIFHPDICPSIRRKTNFSSSTCRSPCRRTILVAAICPSHYHRTNRVSTRGGARLLRLIVPSRCARQSVGVSRILCITNFPHGYLTAVFLLSFNTGESTFQGECAYLCVTSFPLFHFKTHYHT